MPCVNWCSYQGAIPDKPDSPIAEECEVVLATFSNWARNEILGLFSGETPVVPSEFWVAAVTTASSAAAAGTEQVGDGYGRWQITFERVSDIKRWNPNKASSPSASGAWSIAGLALYDAQSGGNYWAFANYRDTLTVDVNSGIVNQATKFIIGMGAPVT